jgi:hypothetical protein
MFGAGLTRSQNITLEHRNVVTLVQNEGLSEFHISARLHEHYHEATLSWSQVYMGAKRFNLGRTNLVSISPPGRELDETLRASIAEADARDHSFSA